MDSENSKVSVNKSAVMAFQSMKTIGKTTLHYEHFILSMK